MMRRHFDEQLLLLNKQLIEMGALCEEAISRAAQSVGEADAGLARQVAPLGAEINRKEREIEALCLKMLLQQQPVARDLRQISAALKMITDMERIGDQASDIAEIVAFLDGKTGHPFDPIRDMARETIRMVTQSVDAYVKRDVRLAQAVINYDDVVDNCFTRIKGDLIAMIAENRGEGEYALDLLMIAKYFERIGDHAVNIGEWVIFSVTGVHEEEKP